MFREGQIEERRTGDGSKDGLQHVAGGGYQGHCYGEEFGAAAELQLRSRCDDEASHHGSNQQQGQVGDRQQSRRPQVDDCNRQVAHAAGAVAQLLPTGRQSPQYCEPQQTQHTFVLNPRREQQSEDGGGQGQDQEVGLIEAASPR